MPVPCSGSCTRTWRCTDKAEAQNRKLQEIVFPREYAGFYFATATFLLGLLLGGILSVEGKPFPVTLGSAGIIILFFGIICILYVRAQRFQMEIQPGCGLCCVAETRAMGAWAGSNEAVVLGFLVFVFIIGTVSGIGGLAVFPLKEKPA